jgi:alanyl-tRNA synthetase
VEVQAIEEKVNSVISADMKVTEEFLNRNAAESEFNLKRLPDEAGEIIRIIRIGDYDVCPCSGTHVNSTKEIGAFKIISTGFENGVLRVRFKLVD